MGNKQEQEQEHSARQIHQSKQNNCPRHTAVQVDVFKQEQGQEQDAGTGELAVAINYASSRYGSMGSTWV